MLISYEAERPCQQQVEYVQHAVRTQHNPKNVKNTQTAGIMALLVTGNACGCVQNILYLEFGIC